MAGSKLRILVMRDNEKVRSLRLNAAWLTILVWLFIILACLAALGGTASWWLYQKYVQFQESDQEKDRHIVELRYQLERYRNMEKLIASGGSDPGLAAALDEPPVVEPVLPPVVDPAPLPPVESLQEPEKPSTAHLRNVSIRPRSGTQIRLSFDISNASDGAVLTGHILVAIQTKDDRFVDVFPPRDELAFQIARFKRVATIFSLPENVAMNDVKAVRIQVRFSNGSTMAPEIFSFPTPAPS